MNLVSFALSWSPVLVLAVLAVGPKRPALELSVYGVVFTAGLASLAFLYQAGRPYHGNPGH